jgi:hypothetical protein
VTNIDQEARVGESVLTAQDAINGHIVLDKPKVVTSLKFAKFYT